MGRGRSPKLILVLLMAARTCFVSKADNNNNNNYDSFHMIHMIYQYNNFI